MKFNKERVTEIRRTYRISLFSWIFVNAYARVTGKMNSLTYEERRVLYPVFRRANRILVKRYVFAKATGRL